MDRGNCTRREVLGLVAAGVVAGQLPRSARSADNARMVTRDTLRVDPHRGVRAPPDDVFTLCEGHLLRLPDKPELQGGLGR